MEVYSRYLQEYLQRLIGEQTPDIQIKLKSLAHCGEKLIPSGSHVGGVWLLSNDSEASFFGNISCKNPFACPVCAARKMSEYAKQFAALIDEMEKRGYFAFMMTFTVPHLKFMSAYDSTEILYQTIRYCKRVKVRGKSTTIFRKFFDKYVEHYIHVLEYTYGKNGWHPHIHGLHFCKVQYKDEILQFQKELNEYWLKQTHRITLKYYPHLERLINGLYANMIDIDTGIYISQKNGKIFECKAAHYVAGWGVSQELTQLEHKTAAVGHYTPHQVLEKAYYGDKEMADVYIKFCLDIYTKAHRRVTWSHTGIHAIAKNAAQAVRCKDLVKKNTCEKWTALLYFDKEQWYCIRELSAKNHCYLLSNILYLAAHHREILFEFLGGMNIEYHLPNEHFFTKHIENIMNKEVA